jgi:hypothetical protein
VNFNVSFNVLLEQFNCAFSWINKGRDNIKMHGTNVRRRKGLQFVWMLASFVEVFACCVSLIILHIVWN